MAALIIRDLPESLHSQLMAEARKNRRSMSKQVVSLLEKALGSGVPPLDARKLPPLARPRKPVDAAFLAKAIRAGRA